MSKGQLIVVEEKARLMKKLGKKQLTLHLAQPLAAVPPGLEEWRLALRNEGADIEYNFEADDERSIPALLKRLDEVGVGFRDLQTRQSSLEDIFVSLTSTRP